MRKNDYAEPELTARLQQVEELCQCVATCNQNTQTLCKALEQAQTEITALQTLSLEADFIDKRLEALQEKYDDEKKRRKAVELQWNQALPKHKKIKAELLEALRRQTTLEGEREYSRDNHSHRFMKLSDPALLTDGKDSMIED